MAHSKPVLAFDAYGTLLSTTSIAAALSSHFGPPKATTIAQIWRKHQLEYTWRANSMGIYSNFSLLTRRALRNSIAEAGCSALSDAQVEDVMAAYDNLDIFPDVEGLLKELKGAGGELEAVIFSNGTHEMVSNSVKSSPSLGPSAELFSAIVSVDSLRKFKPAPESYRHLAQQVNKTDDQMSEIWLVSGNPFDIVGGRAVGMNAIWVDREGTGWIDDMVEGEIGAPTAIVRGLGEVVGVVKERAGK